MAYIFKLLSTEASFLNNNNIKHKEGFFVYSGLGGFDINEKGLWTVGGSTANIFGPNANAVYNAYQTNYPATSGIALGSTLIQEAPNPSFNRGFMEACNFYVNALSGYMYVDLKYGFGAS